MSVSKHYQQVECPNCHIVGVPHATVGERCPALVAKARRLVKSAQNGDPEAITTLIKHLGADRALDVANPHHGGM